MNEAEEKQLRDLIYDFNLDRVDLESIINLVNEIIHSHETKERMETIKPRGFHDVAEYYKDKPVKNDV